MGRTMKRVPLDFSWPLNKVWYGYLVKPSCCFDGKCDDCHMFSKIKGVPNTDWGCPDYDKHFGLAKVFEPPVGDGFQLWETTSEGSPVSPVFDSLDALCEWCATNATTFGHIKATQEQWKHMLSDDFVVARIGNAIFM